MKTLKNALTDFNARNADENTIQAMFAETAATVLSGGYFQVNESTRIYPMDIEFYLYGEREDDPDWMKDINMYHKGKDVPYFPVVGTFYPHESGVDVTFENKDEQYRASFLIRAYKYEKNGPVVSKPRFLWEDLFGYESFLGAGLNIKWVDAPDDVLEVNIDTDVRFHLKDANKQQDIKPWRFIRVNLK